MSLYSEKVKKSKQDRLFTNGDFEGGKEVTLKITYLLQDVEKFGRKMDILFFSDSNQQLEIKPASGNADILISLFGDEPDKWCGGLVTLFLDEYKPGKFSIKIKAAVDNGLVPAVVPRKPDALGDGVDDLLPY
jgi:hypothetical protein